MHRIDTDGSVSGLFSDGTPSVAPATVVDAAWLNDIQENVCQAVTAAGITLVKGTGTQLRDAVNALILAAVTPDTTVDAAGANNATIANALRFGQVGSGEGIGSKRTGGGNQFGLDLYTNSTARVQVALDGSITLNPAGSNAIHVVSSEFASGVTQPGVTGFEKLVYWKDPTGTVHLQGRCDFASSTGRILLTLPAGFRPQGEAVRPCIWESAPGSLEIFATGVVQGFGGAGVTAWIDVTFRTDIAST